MSDYDATINTKEPAEPVQQVSWKQFDEWRAYARRMAHLARELRGLAVNHAADNARQAETIRGYQIRDRERCGKAERLEAKLIYGFFENTKPVYTQGDQQLTELHELVTAAQVNALIDRIESLVQELDDSRASGTCAAIDIRTYTPGARGMVNGLDCTTKRWFAEDIVALKKQNDHLTKALMDVGKTLRPAGLSISA